MTKRPEVIGLALALALVEAVAAGARQEPATGQLPRDEARERNLRAYTELLRSDIRTQKIAAVSQLMELTDAQDAVFWPIYREYEHDLRQLNDDRLALIERYAEEYATLTPASLNDLVVKALDLDAKRAALRQQYYTRLKAVLPVPAAAKAVQIEYQFQLLVDLQVAASLPVIEKAGEGAR